ncbi:MAG: His-Xaa-Ser system radical SAM maturase HxsB [Candidatus Omnitrophota bacterium]|nr:His-Xaa-Ser system radical SAM maturase HxsB [Candidatus Omnitrophota bacterium]
MAIDVNLIDKKAVSYFRFKRFNGSYLVTNDVGEYCFLKPGWFNSFIKGEINEIMKQDEVKYDELINKSFVRNKLDFDKLIAKYANKHDFLSRGTSLHIIVVTLRCDHKCAYCQANSGGIKTAGLDMDIPTAKSVVDKIFEFPAPEITIEFQGGEPLLNFNTVKFIIEYAKKKNKNKEKKLTLSLVSNLSCLTDEILKFLIKNDVSICTSLDGPEHIHNRNRVSLNKNINSYRNTVKWLRKIKIEFEKTGFKHRPNALLTVTNRCFGHSKEIIDEYIKGGLDCIHLRPLSTFALAPKADSLAYSWGEFIEFYKESLDYILELNLKGSNFYERTAFIFLYKILTDYDPGYMDMRSPCGAGIGQVAYNYNGDIYTCDEGRMLSRLGDESFKVGNVKTDTYKNIIEHPTVKAMCISSCLDNIPECSQCVYKPYCGVCPLLNYTESKNIFQPFNGRCKINGAILDYLFEKLQNSQYKNIFERWVKDCTKGKAAL